MASDDRLAASHPALTTQHHLSLNTQYSLQAPSPKRKAQGDMTAKVRKKEKLLTDPSIEMLENH